jgi:hypothetical protein
MLQARWEQGKKPAAGRVFPSQRGKRAGERKQGKISYAKALRGALWSGASVEPQSLPLPKPNERPEADA